MKLLLDENLSPKLVPLIDDVFPGSIHVRDVELASATDEQVWKYASRAGYVIVSKDADFHQRSLLYGSPPKVVWLRRGNCPTESVLAILREHRDDVARFVDDHEAAFLVVE